MAKCEFECSYLDDLEECDQVQGGCIGDDCENWKRCECCADVDECDRARIY